MRTTVLYMVILTSLLTACSSMSETKEEHESDEQHQEHAGEIVFTEEQASIAGLTTEIVSVKPFAGVIKTSGKLQNKQNKECVIVATSAGVVSFGSIGVTEGCKVQAGDLIVNISAKNLQEGDPAIKLKIVFETAQKEYDRAKLLIKEQIISDKDFEQVRLRYETTKAAYLGQAENMVADGIKVVSPINGYIQNVAVKNGDYVSVGQVIAIVVQNKQLQLNADISERNYKYLSEIEDANFVCNGKLYKLSSMNGQLLSYGKMLDYNSFYIPVIFELDNPGDLLSGSYVDVYLLLRERANLVSVPISSITEEQGLYFVYVKIEPDAYKKVEVLLGDSNGERVEIRQGLSKGDEVVVSGVIQVKLASMSSAIPSGHHH